MESPTEIEESSTKREEHGGSSHNSSFYRALKEVANFNPSKMIKKKRIFPSGVAEEMELKKKKDKEGSLKIKFENPKQEKIAGLFVTEHLKEIPSPDPALDWFTPKNIDNLADVHPDIVIHILSFLYFRSFRQISRIARVSTNFRQAVQSNYFWKYALPLLKRKVRYVKNDANILVEWPDSHLTYNHFVETYKKSYGECENMKKHVIYKRRYLKPLRRFYCCFSPLFVMIGVFLSFLIIPFIMKTPGREQGIIPNKFYFWLIAALPTLVCVIPFTIVVWVGMYLDYSYSTVRTRVHKNYYSAFPSRFKPVIAFVLLISFSIIPFFVISMFLKGALGSKVPYSLCFMLVYFNTGLYLLIPICFWKIFKVRSYMKTTFFKLVAGYVVGFIFHLFVDLQILLLTLYLDEIIVVNIFVLLIPFFVFVIGFFVVWFVAFYIYSCWDEEYETCSDFFPCPEPSECICEIYTNFCDNYWCEEKGCLFLKIIACGPCFNCIRGSLVCVVVLICPFIFILLFGFVAGGYFAGIDFFQHYLFSFVSLWIAIVIIFVGVLVFFYWCLIFGKAEISDFYSDAFSDFFLSDEFSTSMTVGLESSHGTDYALLWPPDRDRRNAINFADNEWMYEIAMTPENVEVEDFRTGDILGYLENTFSGDSTPSSDGEDHNEWELFFSKNEKNDFDDEWEYERAETPNVEKEIVWEDNKIVGKEVVEENPKPEKEEKESFSYRNVIDTDNDITPVGENFEMFESKKVDVDQNVKPEMEENSERKDFSYGDIDDTDEGITPVGEENLEELEKILDGQIDILNKVNEKKSMKKKEGITPVEEENLEELEKILDGQIEILNKVNEKKVERKSMEKKESEELEGIWYRRRRKPRTKQLDLTKVVARYDFPAETEREMSVRAGEVLDVLTDQGDWMVLHNPRNQEIGLVPSTFVKFREIKRRDKL